METTPPRVPHPNKKAVLNIACPLGTVYSGDLIFSKWTYKKKNNILFHQHTSLN